MEAARNFANTEVGVNLSPLLRPGRFERAAKLKSVLQAP